MKEELLNLIDKLETYSFTDKHGHPLENCKDWQDLKDKLDYFEEVEQEMLKKIVSVLGYCGRWNDTDIIECKRKTGHAVSMRVDVFKKAISSQDKLKEI